jgi:hypothetical protein
MTLPRGLSLAGGAWERFWFQPEPLQALAICRILLFGGILFDFMHEDFTYCHEAAQYYWKPLSFYAKIMPHGPPSEAWLAALQLLWKISLFTSMIGLFTRISTLFAAGAGIFLVGLVYNFGKIDHHMGAAAIGMLVLAFSECGKIDSADEWLARRRGKSYPPISGADARWPIQLMRVVISLVFFGAGLNKLETSGLAWVTSESMQMDLIMLGTPLGQTFVQWPWLCHLLGGFALTVEFFHPLALFSKRLAVILVPAGFVLFVGICTSLDITFEMFAYVQFFWLPWRRIYALGQEADGHFEAGRCQPL